MFRRILVASDLTESSAQALRAALGLARRMDAELVALHVSAPPYPPGHWFVPRIGDAGPFLRDISDRERAAAARLLDEKLREAEPEGLKGMHVKTMVKTGDPAETIVDAARELGSDLVVVGTHARKGVQHMLLGSVAERVLRTAPCPVLTVRTERKQP